MGAEHEKNDLSLSSSQKERQAESEEERIALDKACVRKLDLTVLPLAAIIYFLSFLDKSNLGNASVAGLRTDLKLSSHQYLTVVTCTYVLYIICELPSNLLLRKVGPQYMIPAMVTLWGFICTMHGLVKGYRGLVALRLMLGFAEGGILPGLVLYLSTFYRRRELQLRISFFFSATSLSGAFSGLLAAAIINMKGVGGQAGWRWIFYLEGICTVLFGFLTFFLLPGTPSTCRYLTPLEREHVVRRLALDAPVEERDLQARFSWTEVINAFKSPHVLFVGAALFGNGCTLYSFSYFTPQIVATFKQSAVHTQLLTVPPFVCAFLVTLLTAYWSDKHGRRGASVIGTSLLAMVGYCVFLTRTSRSAKYASLFLSIIGVYGTAPALSTWMPNNSAGHYRQATAVAFGFIMTNSAGIMSTWLFPTNEAPSYRRGTIVNLSMALMTALFGAINLLYLSYANKQKEERRQRMTGMGEEDTVVARKEGEIEGDRHVDFTYTY
ncbi:MFS general substrate transporter [Meredithblackwellia eburnea MCA 4105]